MQWGYEQIGNNSNSNKTIRFPFSFNATPNVIAVLTTSFQDSARRNMFQIYDITQTTFTAFGNSVAVYGASWIAVGY